LPIQSRECPQIQSALCGEESAEAAIRLSLIHCACSDWPEEKEPRMSVAQHIVNVAAQEVDFVEIEVKP
jgi:hypothetical protein